MLKFTTITVCFNEAETIERTIKSVLAQGYQNTEYLIIDGGSRDGTVELAKKYTGSRVTLISEKDNGIYDAMNKALNLATGDILYFLNADDYFYDDNVLSLAAKCLEDDQAIDILSGKIEFFNTPVINGKHYQRENFLFRNKLELYRNPNGQQCVFSRKSLFDKIGNFNLSYPLCADYEWLIRAINNNANISFVDSYFSNVDYQGVSYTSNTQRLREKRKIILLNSSLREIFLFIVLGLKQKIGNLLHR
ncbi:glycosyltransferase [Gammaproteobacteria bacterium]|nr:glycosyltransferase [Gammaproteobacteria bacterium]